MKKTMFKFWSIIHNYIFFWKFVKPLKFHCICNFFCTTKHIFFCLCFFRFQNFCFLCTWNICFATFSYLQFYCKFLYVQESRYFFFAIKTQLCFHYLGLKALLRTSNEFHKADPFHIKKPNLGWSSMAQNFKRWQKKVIVPCQLTRLRFRGNFCGNNKMRIPNNKNFLENHYCYLSITFVCGNKQPGLRIFSKILDKKNSLCIS